jgi:hypothetical protein
MLSVATVAWARMIGIKCVQAGGGLHLVAVEKHLEGPCARQAVHDHVAHKPTDSTCATFGCSCFGKQ